MTKSKAPQLPKVVFIRWNEPDLPEDDDNQFLMEYKTLYAAAEADTEHVVGVYELKEIKKVTLEVTEKLISK